MASMFPKDINEVATASVEQARIARETGSLIALALWVLDGGLTFRYERRLVWPISLSPLKMAYFILRWSPLFLEPAGIAMELYVGRYAPHSLVFCANWHAGQTAAVQILLTMVEAIQALRAYCLWDRNTSVGLLLGSLLVGQLAVMTAFGYRTSRSLSYDVFCYFDNVPRDQYYFTGAATVFHTAIWALTMCRHFTAQHLNWRKMPIVRMIMTDGVRSLFIILSIYLVSVILSGIKHCLAYVSGGMFVTALSFFGSRTILNQLRVSFERGTAPSIAFTTRIASDHTYEGSELPELRSTTSSHVAEQFHSQTRSAADSSSSADGQ